MRKKWVLPLCLGLFLATSCNYRRVNIAGTPATPYHASLNSLTKHKKIYGLDKVIFDTYATYFSTDLRSQYVDEYATVFELDAIEKEELLETQTLEGEQFDVFYIAHFASDDGYQRLGEHVDDKIIWAIRLVDQDISLRPISIEPLQRTAHQNHFFPHMDAFSKLYKITFRKSADTHKVLRFSSPARNFTFEWKNQ